jgi:hypothetical protein
LAFIDEEAEVLGEEEESCDEDSDDHDLSGFIEDATQAAGSVQPKG